MSKLNSKQLGYPLSGSFTGSLFGTSSYALDAVSASFAISASRAISSSFSTTSSYALNAGTTINTGSFVTTSSFNAYTGSSTSQFAGTSSFAITASHALNAGSGGTVSTSSLLTTASVSLNTITFTKGDGSTFPITVNTGSGGGSGTGFPYTGSATITGSLIVTGSVYFPSLITSPTAITDVVMYGANGQLFITASSAVGRNYEINEYYNGGNTTTTLSETSTYHYVYSSDGEIVLSCTIVAPTPIEGKIITVTNVSTVTADLTGFGGTSTIANNETFQFIGIQSIGAVDPSVIIWYKIK